MVEPAGSGTQAGELTGYHMRGYHFSPAVEENRRRRALAEVALKRPDVRLLSNREIARRLNIGVWAVRWARRRLQECGEIPTVHVRMAKSGYMMDVTRTGEATRKYVEDAR